MAVRVVSAPPAMNSPTSWKIASGGSGLPSIFACDQMDMKSSRGHVATSCMIGIMAPRNSRFASMNSFITHSSRSRMSVRINRSLHDFTCGQISSGKPSKRAVSRAGNCPAMRSMTSNSLAETASATNSATNSSTSVVRRATPACVSCGCTNIRCWR